MIKKTHGFLLLAIVLILGTSCSSTSKMVYFKDLEKVKQANLISSPQDNLEHKIENNEVLSIRITSPTTDENVYKLFNTTNDYKVGTAINGTGYLVDNDGNIEIPLLGQIKAAGQTKTQLKQTILKQLEEKRLLLDPIVEIRFLNYEVTILGEVVRPMVINVPTEKISLLKALGQAGDITPFGKRDNVMVIRESEGKKIVTRVNLSSSTFLQSPFYYLQPNDVVYVETTSNRAAAIDKTRLILPSILSAISVGVTVFYIIKRNN
jgi:polysaccharide biosynthesis/export protein